MVTDFVRGVVNAVFRTAVTATERLLEAPPGRSPDPRLLDLSNWYSALTSQEQARVRQVIALAADQAVFGMLTGLDGARRLLARDEVLGVVLEAQTARGRVALTGASLHDEYRRFVDPMGQLHGNDSSDPH